MDNQLLWDGAFRFKISGLEHFKKLKLRRAKEVTGKYACTGRSNYQLFQEAAENSGLNYDALDRKCCYMFERVHPDFRVVLDYPEPKIFHIGTRNMETLEELEVNIGVAKPKSWPVKSAQECQALLDSFHSFAEGVVVKDSEYRRQKWKRREYVMLHSARMLVGADGPCHLTQTVLPCTLRLCLGGQMQYGWAHGD